MSSRSKIITKALSILVLSVTALGFSGALTVKEVKAASVENANTKTIEVTGTGSIKAVPDIAVLNVGVMTKGVDTISVQDNNTKTMNKVLEAVKALGIDEKDIRTVDYNMYPDYDQSETKNGNGNKIIGYTLNNSVEIKVRDINKAGQVLSAAVNAGANINNGISFSLSNVDDYYNQALEKAMLNAKAKADTLAKAIGVSISTPSKVVENSYNYPSPVSNYNSMRNADMAAAEVAVSQGELEVTANVSVTYAY